MNFIVNLHGSSFGQIRDSECKLGNFGNIKFPKYVPEGSIMSPEKCTSSRVSVFDLSQLCDHNHCRHENACFTYLLTVLTYNKPGF